MSELGYSPYEPLKKPEPPAPTTIPLWVLWAAVAALLLGSGLVVLVLLHPTRSKPPVQTYPSSWDPRILPYVRIVEKERGLPFLHPVAVRFLPAAAFEKTVAADDSKLNAQDRQKIEQTTGLFRAMGLLSGNVDLFKAFNSAQSSSTLAYYSFDDQRITVRGTHLVLAAHATLVHELTHALQDQQFGIGKRQQQLAKLSDESGSTTESDVLDAIVEGDAERIASEYRASLPPAQRRRLVAAENAYNSALSAKVPDVPPIVLTFIGAPYDLGQALVDSVAANGGNHQVDNLLRDAPSHDAALLDPFRVLLQQTDAVHVDAPRLQSGEKKIQNTGEFGALTWYLMLSERLPLRDALAAADGWGGDQALAYTRSGQSCARVTFVGTTAADTTRMYAALQRWTAAAPGTPTSVTRDPAHVYFSTCDPGTAGHAVKNESAQALDLAVTRTYVSLGVMKAGGSLSQARCVGNKLIDNFSIAVLNTQGPVDAATRAKIIQLVAACR